MHREFNKHSSVLTINIIVGRKMDRISALCMRANHERFLCRNEPHPSIAKEPAAKTIAKKDIQTCQTFVDAPPGNAPPYSPGKLICKLRRHHLRTPYSCQIGTFDVTICTGDDGRLVMLIICEDERRATLNRVPIWCIEDGDNGCRGVAPVTHYKPHPLMTKYARKAMAVRARMRRTDHGESQDEDMVPIPLCQLKR